MKDLMLVHGWGFGAGVWQRITEQLPPDWRVQTPALTDWDIASQASPQVPAGTIVCGWSLGALWAMQLAERHPDRIAKLVLVGATPRFTSAPDWPQAQAPEILDGFAAAVATEPKSALRRFAALLNQGDEHARSITRYLTDLPDEQPSPGFLSRGLDALRDLDLRSRVAAIRVPTLLVHGRHDSLMPLAAARWLAETLPTARLEVFPNAAHAPFLSDPERFVAVLRDFADE